MPPRRDIRHVSILSWEMVRGTGRGVGASRRSAQQGCTQVWLTEKLTIFHLTGHNTYTLFQAASVNIHQLFDFSEPSGISVVLQNTASGTLGLISDERSPPPSTPPLIWCSLTSSRCLPSGRSLNWSAALPASFSNAGKASGSTVTVLPLSQFGMGFPCCLATTNQWLCGFQQILIGRKPKLAERSLDSYARRP